MNPTEDAPGMGVPQVIPQMPQAGMMGMTQPVGQMPGMPGQLPPMPGQMPPGYGGANEQRSRIVYVDVGDEQPSPPDIQTAFCPYGLIEKINVTPSDGRYGVFVTYSSMRAATRVARLGQIMVGNHSRIIHVANRPDPGCAYDRPGLFLWVGMGARNDILQDDIGNCFAQFGDVQKVDMHQDDSHNYAIVTFCTPDTAMAAYNAQPSIKGCDLYIEWFHPGEPLGAVAPQAPVQTMTGGSAMPTPEETRKLIMKYSLSSMIMEEEIVAALKPEVGEPEKIAIGIDGDSKVAHVIFPTQMAAKKCKDDWDSGKLDIPNATNLTVEWSMLPPSAHGQSPVPTLAPSTNICLQYNDKDELDNIGLETIKRIFETTIGGIDNCQTRDKYAFINFKEVSSAIMAMERLPALNIPGAPVAKYARKTTSTTPSSSTSGVPQMPTIGSTAVSAVTTLAAQCETFGGPPPVNLPPKNSKPPVDKNVQALIDSLAQEAAAGNAVPDVELVMRTDNAGYYRYKADWVKLGVERKTFDALAKMRKAAEACRRQEALLQQEYKPEHLSDYKEQNAIPFTDEQNILVLAEKNLSFAASLLKRIGTGAKLVVTTTLPKEELFEKYSEAAERAKELVDAGAKIGYGFNVTKSEEYADLPTPEAMFDAVVLNYPVPSESGADVQGTDDNQKFVKKILKYCPAVLTSKGRVYITQCEGSGYSDWQTTRLGLRSDGGLRLINKFIFRGNEYPGYQPVYATFDPPAKYRNSMVYVFGRKKRYDAFDNVEEREVELERIKEKRRRRRDSSESSGDRKKKRKEKKRDESEDDEPLRIENQPRPEPKREEPRERQRDHGRVDRGRDSRDHRDSRDNRDSRDYRDRRRDDGDRDREYRDRDYRDSARDRDRRRRR